jgi:hypothetical protein
MVCCFCSGEEDWTRICNGQFQEDYGSFDNCFLTVEFQQMPVEEIVD